MKSIDQTLAHGEPSLKRDLGDRSLALAMSPNQSKVLIPWTLQHVGLGVKGFLFPKKGLTISLYPVD